MKILSIKIKDFLSIKYLEYNFEDGLHLFTGNNGSGKSSILTALQVGLYGKCDRPPPLARLSGPGGFIIEVEFTSTTGTNVKVINNRTKNRYEVYENGELLTHQISKGIPIVSKMLNLTYLEFSLLTFLTPTTVSDILTQTDSSLISKFFSLDKLSEYDKSLREERRTLTKDKKKLEAKLLEGLEETKVYNVKELEVKASGLRMRKLTAMNSQVVKEELPKLERELLSIYDTITMNTSKVSEANGDLMRLGSLGSKCELCGHDLDEDTTAKLRSINIHKDNISFFEEALVSDNKIANKLNSKIQAIREPHEIEMAELEESLRQTDAELIAASIITKKDSIDIDNINSELSIIERKVYSLNLAIGAIKEGTVHKAYLETFTSVLNTKLGIIKEDLSLSMRIIAKISSSGLVFSILDDGVFKSAVVLSAGEKTIVGLVVLNALFETLQDTLDIHISTIMLDEAIATVSTENMQIVEKILKELSKSKCVIVTMHHKELPEDIFDTVSRIVKEDGLTNLREN